MSDFERVTYPEDPERCQGLVAGKDQCIMKATPGSRFCALHGSNKTLEANAVKAANNYRLTQFQARIAEFSDNSSIKMLNEEVAILRMLIETRINACQTPMDLMLQSGPISELTMKVKDLVIHMDKLQDKLGKHVDASKILDFASRIIDIIGSHLKGQEEILEVIASDILRELGTDA